MTEEEKALKALKNLGNKTRVVKCMCGREDIYVCPEAADYTVDDCVCGRKIGVFFHTDQIFCARPVYIAGGIKNFLAHR
jgi:hypothetical protein